MTTSQVVTVLLKAKIKEGCCEAAREVVEKLCRVGVENEPGLVTCRVSLDDKERILTEVLEWANMGELVKHYAVYATRPDDMAKFKDCIETMIDCTLFLSESDAQNIPEEVQAMNKMYNSTIVPFNLFTHRV